MGRISLILIALISLGLWFLLTRQEPSKSRDTAPPRPSSISPSLPEEKPKPDPSLQIPHSPLANSINQTTNTPQRDLEIIDTLLFQTRQALKNLARKPMGTNAEFTAVLTGDNDLNLAAIPPNHPAINSNGELVDRWGTPLHFHPISSSETTLRSAGPDQKLFTNDDLVYPTIPPPLQ